MSYPAPSTTAQRAKAYLEHKRVIKSRLTQEKVDNALEDWFGMLHQHKKYGKFALVLKLGGVIGFASIEDRPQELYTFLASLTSPGDHFYQVCIMWLVMIEDILQVKQRVTYPLPYHTFSIQRQSLNEFVISIDPPMENKEEESKDEDPQ